MAGTKINEATLRSTLKGTEEIPFVDTYLPKGKTTTADLKKYCEPDLSGYAKKTDIPDMTQKVSGTGVTSVSVVSELPESPSDTMLYIVVPADAESTL